MSAQRRRRTDGVTYVAAALVAAASAAAWCASASTATRMQLEAPTLIGLASPVTMFRSTTLSARGLRQISSTHWHGGRYLTASGASVTVLVSPAYTSGSATAEQWAEFFASLVHGPELGLLSAYFAPLEEVHALCGGGDGVLGCYGADKLVAVGDSSGGISPTSVAAHEYGHHVAYHEINPPWIAEDWGTKRWATYMNICSRTAAGTAFPGSEGADYPLNPGEAFAETYRVLNETRGGVPLTWSIVDGSFRPDAQALQAVNDDVVSPWSGPSIRRIHSRFAPGRKSWTLELATPLDGQLSIALEPGSDGLELLAGDARSVLGQSVWTGDGGRAIDFQVCGRRSLVVRVRRGGPARAFTLRISVP
jgi:hypothetical protein